MAKVLVLIYIDGIKDSKNADKKIILTDLQDSTIEDMVSLTFRKSNYDPAKMQVKDLRYFDQEFEEDISVEHPFSEQKVEHKKYEMIVEFLKEVMPVFTHYRNSFRTELFSLCQNFFRTV